MGVVADVDDNDDYSNELFCSVAEFHQMFIIPLKPSLLSSHNPRFFSDTLEVVSSGKPLFSVETGLQSPPRQHRHLICKLPATEAGG